MWPFQKLVGKGTQLFLWLSLFPLMSLLRLSWQDIGFNGKNPFYRQLRQGMITGLLILGPIIALLYALDIRDLKTDKIWTFVSLLKTLSGAFVTALLISLIEEPIFRGLLLTAIYKRMGLCIALLVSAVYYAGLHFLKTGLHIAYADLNVVSVSALLADALSNPFQWIHLQAFIALFMVGIFLGLVRLRMNLGLGFCIGCHAGWVFLIKMTKSMSDVNVNSDYFFLVSPYDGVIGPLVSIWLIAAVLFMLFYRKTMGKV